VNLGDGASRVRCDHPADQIPHILPTSVPVCFSR
jgi:hypothetical protein